MCIKCCLHIFIVQRDSGETRRPSTTIVIIRAIMSAEMFFPASLRRPHADLSPPKQLTPDIQRLCMCIHVPALFVCYSMRAKANIIARIFRRIEYMSVLYKVITRQEGTQGARFARMAMTENEFTGLCLSAFKSLGNCE